MLINTTSRGDKMVNRIVNNVLRFKYGKKARMPICVIDEWMETIDITGYDIAIDIWYSEISRTTVKAGTKKHHKPLQGMTYFNLTKALNMGDREYPYMIRITDREGETSYIMGRVELYGTPVVAIGSGGTGGSWGHHYDVTRPPSRGILR